ncbi:hypothetical protein GCM10010446_67320 [Streptomyces enissocaesilis]|uniref:Uncharacterized protein n=1 Tax=Streptomyces enissocaesilis TaxID=332589 RepID=A0ABN3XNK5_9ACTN
MPATKATTMKPATATASQSRTPARRRYPALTSWDCGGPYPPGGPGKGPGAGRWAGR